MEPLVPHITGGLLDSDKDIGDVPVEVTPDLYVAAADATLAAIAADTGLVSAEINQYLPVVKTALSNAAKAFPGAGTLISAVLKILPNSIP